MNATKFLINGVYFNLPSGGSGGGSGAPRYTHYIEAEFTDGCDETHTGVIILENDISTQLSASDFKALFTKQVDSDKYIIPAVTSQYYNTYSYSLCPCVFTYGGSIGDDFYAQTENNTDSLGLSSITDTVIQNESGGSGSSGGTALYNHSIKARFMNNCYEEFDVIVKFQSSDDTQITTEAGFKALFSEAISTDSENDSYNYRIIPFLNSTYIVDTTYQFISGAIQQVILGYDTVNDCFTYKDDYNGPSTFVTGGTITDTVTPV